MSRCPSDGAALELGSGGGYLRDAIPDVMTLDVLPYPGIEKIVAARGEALAEGAADRAIGAELAQRADLADHAQHHVHRVAHLGLTGRGAGVARAGTSMAEAAVALSRDFGLSRRQAYRYLEEPQGAVPAPAIAETSVTITLRRSTQVPSPTTSGWDRYWR
jgi:hypothetical protein